MLMVDSAGNVGVLRIHAGCNFCLEGGFGPCWKQEACFKQLQKAWMQSAC